MERSWRFTFWRREGSQSKDMSWVVTARLSLVPANPILSLEMSICLAIILTMRLVSQFLAVTVAMVYLPSSEGSGCEEISVTTKSSALALRRPPVPSASLM